MPNIHAFTEHYHEVVPGFHAFQGKKIYFKNKRGEDSTCLEVYKEGQATKLILSYFVGIDWIDELNVVYVEPKPNKESSQTDYLAMLCSCLSHPDVLGETRNLYEIQFDRPYIEIDQKQDMLTPLLIVQFLQVARIIVKKGLKKSYYPVEENLQSKIKGKISTSRNLRVNTFKNQRLKTVCSFHEFGINSLENRLIKRVLQFIHRYVAMRPELGKSARAVMDYCMPAFALVSDEVEPSDIKATHVSPLFKEYAEAIKLAQLILKRFGYSINNTQEATSVKIPPFWIDMSRLFELYVLGKLKDRFGNQVKYQFTAHWNELDFLLDAPGYKMVIDAKYKFWYDQSYDIRDIRQISGYARLKDVSDALGKSPDEVIDCLIIYPDQKADIDLSMDLKSNAVKGFNHFYRTSVKLPVR